MPPRPPGKLTPLRLLIAVAACLAIATLCWPPPGGEPAAAARAPAPNVIVIQTDDQTLASMRVMKRTRSLIGRRGVTFRNHFASWPECCPARVTQLTGQYAHNHGVLGQSRAEQGGYRNFTGQGRTLPVWLSKRGYRTAHLGKYVNGYGNGDAAARREIPPGWDEWYTSVGRSTQEVYGYLQNENGRLVRYGERRRDFKQDVLTRAAVGLIRRDARPDGTSGRPLYLQLDYTAPHRAEPRDYALGPKRCGDGAYPAPRHAQRFRDAAMPRDASFNEADISDKPAVVSEPPLTDEQIADVERRYRCRLASLLAVDEGVARVIEALEEAGAERESYVIFTSDNGYLLGEHRFGKGKALAYDPSIRVPLLIRGPGFEPGSKRTDATVNPDLTRTITGIAGARPTRVLDGRDLRRPAGARRDVLLETNLYTAIRTQRWLWVEYEGGGRELYDLRDDPLQLESLHDDPATLGVRDELAERLAELRECAGASCR